MIAITAQGGQRPQAGLGRNGAEFLAVGFDEGFKPDDSVFTDGRREDHEPAPVSRMTPRMT